MNASYRVLHLIIDNELYSHTAHFCSQYPDMIVVLCVCVCVKCSLIYRFGNQLMTIEVHSLIFFMKAIKNEAFR